MAVWVRLPRLLVEYYDPLALQEITRMIELVLQIDAHIALEVRGRYARFCVQLDLDKPLPRNLRLGNFKQIIQYEGLNLFCQSCGRIK